MVRALDPGEWDPVAVHPIEGLFEFKGPGEMVLLVTTDGTRSFQVPTA